MGQSKWVDFSFDLPKTELKETLPEYLAIGQSEKLELIKKEF